MSKLIPEIFIPDDADFPDAIQYKRGDESRWYSHPGILEAAESDIERLTAEVTRKDGVIADLIESLDEAKYDEPELRSKLDKYRRAMRAASDASSDIEVVDILNKALDAASGKQTECANADRDCCGFHKQGGDTYAGCWEPADSSQEFEHSPFCPHLQNMARPRSQRLIGPKCTCRKDQKELKEFRDRVRSGEFDEALGITDTADSRHEDSQ